MEGDSIDRQIPARLRDDVQRLEECGISSLYVGKPDKSIECYSKELELLNNAQFYEERPIHKGAVYYMLGISHLYKESPDKALWNLLLAYIEDTLNVKMGMELEADNAPAADMLTHFFQIEAFRLASLRRQVHSVKEKGLWNKAYNPVDILSESLSVTTERDLDSWYNHAVVQNRISVYTKKKKIEFNWEKRVFIGGNYYDSLNTLRKIADIVHARKRAPVLVHDRRIPDEGLISHHSLMLLHTCRLAIFELSVAGGQYFEIARVKDYDIPTLGLYRLDSPYWKSSMLVTMEAKIDFRSYGSDAELKQRIEFFLDTH